MTLNDLISEYGADAGAEVQIEIEGKPVNASKHYFRKDGGKARVVLVPAKPRVRAKTQYRGVMGADGRAEIVKEIVEREVTDGNTDSAGA